ncbi:tetratricopeptide repeat protein [Petrachloros mirabilis]
MASKQKSAASAMEIDRLATQLAKDPHSKSFLPLAEEYCKVDMWEEAVSVLEEGLKHYPGFITAMVALGRAYDQLNQPTKARAVLEGAVKLSPENLRAHRTLIKIYTAQGLTDAALESCNVILAMNPKDEEALSVQASLGGTSQPELEGPARTIPLNTELDCPKPLNYLQDKARATEPESELRSTLSPEPVKMLEQESAAAQEPVFRLEEPIAATDVSALSTTPIKPATSGMEPALKENTPKPFEKQSTAEPRPFASDSTVAPSPHGGTIAQLESWLRSIERQRRDRVTSGDSSS